MTSLYPKIERGARVPASAPCRQWRQPEWRRVTTTVAYAYDPLYRLTSAAYSDTQVYTYTYVYDKAGNRTAMTKTIASTVAFTHAYEYDDANRLTNVDGVTYTWDANGNLLSDGTRTFILRQTQDRHTTSPTAWCRW
jgi:YD repeat-containing protein